MTRLTVVVSDSGGMAGNLEESVRSALAQEVRDVEVIATGAAELPADLLRDPRVRWLEPEGDTDPRNRAAAAARGEFLAFLPGGATVTARGYGVLLASLAASGSDLATGATRRPTTSPVPTSGGKPIFTTSRAGTHVTRMPELLGDQVVGNKVWRRSFWDQHSLRFPDNAPRDDVLVSLRSHLLATGVDVLRHRVLVEPVPADERTLSPRSEDMAAMAEHLDAMRAGAELLATLGNADLKRAWERRLLTGDLQWALRNLNEADDETQQRLVDIAAALLVGAGPTAERSMRALDRLKYHLARRQLLPQLREVVKAERSGELQHTRIVRRGLTYYGDYPFRGDRSLRVPREVYRLGQELNLRARVERAWWDGDTLHIEGVAHIALLDAATRRSGLLHLSLVPKGKQGKAIRLRAERTFRPDVTAASRESSYNYDWSGFRTSVTAAALRARAGSDTQSWRLRATALSGGVLRRRWVTTETSGGDVRCPPRQLDDGVRVVLDTATGSFAVELDPVPAVVTAASVHGEELVLAGRLREPVTGDGPAQLRPAPDGPTGAAEAAWPAVVRVAPGGRDFTARLPVRTVHDAVTIPALTVPGRKRAVPLRADLGLAPVRLPREDGTELTVGRTDRGLLQITHGPARATLEDLEWTDTSMLLRVRQGSPEREATLLLRNRSAVREHAFPMTVDGELLVARFAPQAVTTLAGTLPLSQGSWEMAVRREGAAGPVEPLRVGEPTALDLPQSRTFGAKTFTLAQVDGTLRLQSGPDLLDDERGAVNQRRLQTVEFPAFLARGLRDEVLFESYQSRAYADNARAIYEELVRRDTGLTCRWVVLDGQADLPEGLEPVRRNSRAHYEAQARARWVIVPNYRPLDAWLTTPRDQVVAQTWHGAPFKRIGLDNERGERASSRDYLDALRRESARWNYLLSPNPPSTPILRGAFDYHGEMLETGYPRCDVFFRADRGEIASRVRERLRLPEGKKVVLYAPTMRDDQRYGGNRFALDMQLDLDKARAELGEDHVLLVRRHAKVVDAVSTADGEFARDVSLWPDVNELLLATDVLVTDYSSLMFDFANTGRPMLFFTYDLADYRDRLRGFYFDVERVPGPLLMTSDEVIAGIRDAEQLRTQHATTYDAFVRDFCTWDDGGAAARFVDAVFRG